MWRREAKKGHILYIYGDDTFFFYFLFLTFIHLILESASTASTPSIPSIIRGIYIVKGSKIGY